MRDVYDYAKFFIKNGADSKPNTYDVAVFGFRKMREIISAYRETSSDAVASETINGVTFYFDGCALTEDMIDRLESFSLSADDDTYSVYLDNGRLVIY